MQKCRVAQLPAISSNRPRNIQNNKPATRRSMRKKGGGVGQSTTRKTTHFDAAKSWAKPMSRQDTRRKKGIGQLRKTRSQPWDESMSTCSRHFFYVGNQSSNIKVMGESGQTDQERRRLRRSQRLLHQKITESGCDLDLKEMAQENNTLFENVVNPREAALDASNLDVIAGRVLQKSLKNTKVLQYDADRLVRKLKSKFRHGSGSVFDWASYSNRYGVWASVIPSKVSFRHGPLEGGKPLKEKQRPANRARIVEEECEEEEPEEIQGHAERNADQLSAVQKSIIVLNKTLRKRVAATYQGHKRKLEDIHGPGKIPPKLEKKLKKHGVEIDAIQYLFNPKSFTQTVENLFHYSFLVKNGKATLNVNENGFEKAPGGAVCKYVEDASGKLPSNTQAVLSLSMQDWRDLCKCTR